MGQRSPGAPPGHEPTGVHASAPHACHGTGHARVPSSRYPTGKLAPTCHVYASPTTVDELDEDAGDGLLGVEWVLVVVGDVLAEAAGDGLSDPVEL